MKKILSSLLIGILILGFLFLLGWGVWAILHSSGLVSAKPLDFAALTRTTVTETVAPTEEPAPPSQEPAPPTPPAEPEMTPEVIYIYLTPEPTEESAPTATPTAPAPPVITEQPIVSQPTYTSGGNQVKVPLIDADGKAVKKNKKQIKDYTDTIYFQVNGKWVWIKTFEYHGGYNAAYDPTLSEDKLDEKAFGPTTIDETYEQTLSNDLSDDCLSGLRLVRLGQQCGYYKKLSTDEETRLGLELNAKPADEYDKVANEILKTFFKYLYGGTMEIITDGYQLASIITLDEGPDETWEPEIHGLEQSVTLGKDEYIYTVYAKGEKTTFISSKQGLLNIYNDAKAKGKYTQRTYRRPLWGGNYVWKKGGGSSNPGKPSNNPTPTPTATDAPTSTPQPTNQKDKEIRPKVSDAPHGGGDTNPQNSTDPPTTTHSESTPKPTNAAATPTPTVTPEPHNVPPAGNGLGNEPDATGGEDSFNAP